MDEYFSASRKGLNSKGIFYMNVKVIPNAQKTEAVELLAGVDDEQVLKVKVAAVPEKGKANQVLCEYLAKFFELPKSNVEVVRGQTSQRKVIKLVSG